MAIVYRVMIAGVFSIGVSLQADTVKL